MSRRSTPTSPSPICPRSFRTQIAESTRAAFTQLLKEGYAVGPRQQMQQSRPMDRVPERQRPGSGDRRGPPRGPSQGHRRGGRPPKGGGGGGQPGSRQGQAASVELARA